MDSARTSSFSSLWSPPSSAESPRSARTGSANGSRSMPPSGVDYTPSSTREARGVDPSAAATPASARTCCATAW